jgi:hypothetical protein
VLAPTAFTLGSKFEKRESAAGCEMKEGFALIKYYKEPHFDDYVTNN